MATVLTERYRAQQIALRAQTMREVARLWPALNLTELARTYPALVTALSSVVDRDRARAADLAGVYLQRSKVAAGVRFPLEVLLAGPADPTQVETALRVTSAVAVKKATGRGVALEVAGRLALVQTAGAVSRLVLDAGRETVLETVRREPRAGWQRVTSGRSCDFCQMLAGRGAVYSEDSSSFQSHDSCGCSAEPVFR